MKSGISLQLRYLPQIYGFVLLLLEIGLSVYHRIGGVLVEELS